MKRTLFLLATILTSTILFSQSQGIDPTSPPREGIVYGKIIDQTNQKPVPYTSVSLIRLRDSSIVGGTITDTTGSFRIREVPFGRYNLEASFIGYKKTRMTGVMVTPKNTNVSVGTIKLERSVEEIDGVEITADKRVMEYKIDRKVINVSQDVTSIGGTAADLLENTPSIETDIEGNVSLRGSSNFSVLIDGKPSVLSGNEALQQIPASSIESIEIITNPSVKYNPEGIGGIINIILKKEKQKGFSGIIKTDYRTDPSYGGSILLNYRTEKYNLFIDLDKDYSNHPGTMNMDQQIYSFDSLGNILDTSFYFSRSKRDMYHERTQYKVGVDYYLNKKHTVSLAGRYGNRGFGWESYAENHNYSPLENFEEYYLNNSDFNINRDYYSIDLNHHFITPDRKHELMTYIQYSDLIGTEKTGVNMNYTDNVWNTLGTDDTKTQTSELIGEFEMDIKTEYTLQLKSERKFEAGYEIELDSDTKEYVFSDYNYTLNDFIQVDSLDNNINFKRNIYGLYAIWSDQTPWIDYQIGFRAEYTDRETEQVIMDSTNSIGRMDYFPSIHVSKELPLGQQVLASYSRRIHRPREYYLDPFLYYYDDRNIRTGNPKLEPEYINSYELNYQKKFGKSFVSLEAYHRQTLNKISRVRYLYDDTNDMMLNKFENIDKDFSTGLELMLMLKPTKWCSINASGNFYNYQIETNSSGEDIAKETNTWNSRLTSNFKIKKDTRVQLMLMYRAPTITSQGTREGFFFSNAGIKHDMLNKKLSLTINVRDIFNTGKRSFTSETEDFYSSNIFRMNAPVYSISLIYKINNYKAERKENVNEVEFDSEM